MEYMASVSAFHRNPLSEWLKNGIVCRADVAKDVGKFGELIRALGATVALIIADPPYGGILKVKWDREPDSLEDFVRWMVDWTREWSQYLCDGGAFYTWGGTGKPKMRPFLHYVPRVETCTALEMANWITWKKRKAYGVQNNFLYTREELAWFVKGDSKRPAVFNIQYLDQKRGYDGWNKKHPAKSKYLRRSNVWTDVTEILRGKIHKAEKPKRISEIIIGTHTNPGDIVVDLFSGSGNTSVVANRMGRRYIAVESDEKEFEKICRALRAQGG